MRASTHQQVQPQQTLQQQDTMDFSAFSYKATDAHINSNTYNVSQPAAQQSTRPQSQGQHRSWEALAADHVCGGGAGGINGNRRDGSCLRGNAEMSSIPPSQQQQQQQQHQKQQQQYHESSLIMPMTLASPIAERADSRTRGQPEGRSWEATSGQRAPFAQHIEHSENLQPPAVLAQAQGGAGQNLSAVPSQLSSVSSLSRPTTSSGGRQASQHNPYAVLPLSCGDGNIGGCEGGRGAVGATVTPAPSRCERPFVITNSDASD